MKTPPPPFTIHVIEPQDVVPYIDVTRLTVPRHTPHVRPAVADALKHVGRWLLLSGRGAVVIITGLFRLIGAVGTGVATITRKLERFILIMLEFMFIRTPLFIFGMAILIAVLGGIALVIYKFCVHYLALH